MWSYYAIVASETAFFGHFRNFTAQKDTYNIESRVKMKAMDATK